MLEQLARHALTSRTLRSTTGVARSTLISGGPMLVIQSALPRMRERGVLAHKGLGSRITMTGSREFLDFAGVLIRS
jgi:hypothetical protein